MAKFKLGKGPISVINPKTNKPIVFKNGEHETDDLFTIELLTSNGYERTDIEKKKSKSKPRKTSNKKKGD